MGDSYTLYNLKCPTCKKVQDEVFYGESSGFLTHTCKCGQICRIDMDFSLYPITKKDKEDIMKMFTG